MKHRTKKYISYIFSLLILLTATVWIGSNFIRFGKEEFTDNAQVHRQVIPVISRVQGYIKEIRFSEFQPVKKGDTLVIIDDADLYLALKKAKADYAGAIAGKTVAHKTAETASADVAVSEATLTEARVLMENAGSELRRYENLLAGDAVTRQQYEKILTDYEAKKARYEMLAKQRNVTSSVVDVSRERISQSQASVELAEALVRTAELNLGYTVILAPCDGYASRKEIEVCQLVQPGQTLLDVIDGTDVWVTANFKETQLRHIEPGYTAEIKVDAIPGIVFNGEVASISSATGAELSLLPQDNSSGNFVKVRQRIPVRIRFTENDSVSISRLRSGMNVECVIRY